MFLEKINNLPGPVGDFVHHVGRLADERDVNVYVVGGFVRDLFLNVDNCDLDLVVEGDGVAFAEELSGIFKLRLIAHRRFYTATLSGLEGVKVDIASAREESYVQPAALPRVYGGSIKDDLYRRDFTINAMAMGVNEHHFGKLFDFYGGREDLDKGLVRALHPLSFMDDPTRILRAVRFEQRLEFKIEPKTLSWIKQAHQRRMLYHVQKHRLRDELILMFKEEVPYRGFKRLNDLCGLSFIAPSLRFQKTWAPLFKKAASEILIFKKDFGVKKHLEPYMVFMALFFYSLTPRAIRRLIHAFAFHRQEALRIVSLKKALPCVTKTLSRKTVLSSTVYRILKPLSAEVLVLIMVMEKNRLVKKRIKDFLSQDNDKRPHLKGEDLKELGLKPGPEYKKILSQLFRAKLDGKVDNRDDELAWVKKQTKQSRR